ncbi:MAG: hypothetical protein ACRDCB_13785 [Clostridium sp.]|uniref:hypothetical protein n=2 Tax=Clostridiaceae TaxID=31979 RepID=UPI0021527DCE|nr:hypothetical protein [Clostridium sp. LY3-2]MCR6515875.1 hypothetical protein [Clostridium sp. LY3-2]
MDKYKNFTSYKNRENLLKQSEKTISTYIKIFILINIILLSFNISSKNENNTVETINKESIKEEAISKNNEISEILKFIDNHGSQSEIKDGAGKIKINTLDSLKELSKVKSYNIVKVEGDGYEVTFE